MRAYVAEGLGTALLLAIVVGSGIMGERLAGGNMAIALLANSITTGAGLFVLIAVLAPISGAHFNPVVSALAAWRGELAPRRALGYGVVQILAAVLGVILAHAMFDLELLQLGSKVRSGTGQWISEAVATCGLLLTITLGSRANPRAVPALVASYIAAAYWFTASTSFANPAVTLARGFTGTFAGIRPHDVGGFVLAQIVGAVLAIGICRLLDVSTRPVTEEHAPD